MKRLLLACSLLAAGCFHHAGRDVVAHMPVAQPDAGAIDVVLSDASRALTVAVDGALVVDRAHARRVHVDNVAAGSAQVRVIVGGRCEHAGYVDEVVQVVPGATTTLALPGPDRDHACMAVTTAMHAALALLLVRPAIHLVRALHAHVSS